MRTTQLGDRCRLDLERVRLAPGAEPLWELVLGLTMAQCPTGRIEVPARLGALLGVTRAECLRLLMTPLTTTELAQHLGTSIGNASKHATVLREAGLVSSRRVGGAVSHRTTPLGIALLVGNTSFR